MSDSLWSLCETTLPRNSDGYGRIQIGGNPVTHSRLTYKCYHNLTWKEMKGKVVMHKCDNPPCINPDHLVLGTQWDNIQDMKTKGRDSSRERARLAVITKLTEEQLVEIKGRSSRESQTKLAKEFGVSQGHISHILNGTRR